MSKNCLLFLSLLAVFAVGCKKKNETTTNIVLNAPVASGNKVTLTWSPSTDDRLQGYLVYRQGDTLNKAAAEVFQVDRNTTSFTDSGAPAPSVKYYVAAQIGGNPIATSNTQVYKHDKINFLYLTPKGVIVDKDSSEIYVYSENGDIAFYDLETRMLAGSIKNNVAIGHCCLGVYKWNQELYVPRADGYIYIFDAETLVKIDQIHVGKPLYSVAYHNEVLFVTDDANGFVLAAYDRRTGQLLAEAYNNSKQRVVVLPGTNTTLASVSTYGTINKYRFSDEDGFVDRSSAGIPTGYPLIWYTVMEPIPGSNKMIVSAEGVIIKDGGSYDNRLPRGKQLFTSFDINTTAQQIHASCTTQAVNTYAMADYALKETKVTRGYPVKVFSYGDKLFSVSTSKPIVKDNQPAAQGMYTFIEQL